MGVGYLGFDPVRLRFLRQVICVATIELRARARSTDPEAAAALSTLHAASVALEDRLALVDGLLGSGVLSEYRPVCLDDTGAAGDLLLRQSIGWTITTDPGGAATPLTRADVRDVAQWLAALDGDALFELGRDDEELDRLGGRLLAIARDPQLRAVFEEILPAGAPHWAVVAREVWFRQFQLPDDNATAGARRMFAAIAALHDTEADAQALLPLMEPYAAALLLPHLHLLDAALAGAAFDLVLRWHESPDGGTPLDHATGREQTADLVFRLLAERPLAATEFLVLAAERPAMVFETVHDMSNVRALLAAGVDVGHVDAATAGRIVVPLVRWLTDQPWDPFPSGAGPTYDTLAATMAVPWILHFEDRADEWAWTPAPEAAQAEAHRILEQIVATNGGLATVTALLADIAATEVGLLDVVPSARDSTALDDVVGTMTALLVLLKHQEVDNGDAQRAVFDLIRDIAHGIVDTVIGFIPAGTAVDAGLASLDRLGLGGSVLVEHVLQAWGVAPPDADEVRAVAHQTLNQRFVQVALAIVAAAGLRLVQEGRLELSDLEALTLDDLPEDCPAAAVAQRVDEFIKDLPTDDKTVLILQLTLTKALNLGTAVLSCDVD